MKKISIIIPALNEEKILMKQQDKLTNLLHEGHEVILVDGGSKDKTVSIADNLGITTIVTKPSRGYQLKIGSHLSSKDILLFLHIDTSLSDDGVNSVQEAMSDPRNYWGRFNIKFDNKKMIYRMIAFFMNKRSCLTGSVTGDHAMFIRKDAYMKCGGFSDIPIMEDIEICKRLRKISAPVCLKVEVITSCRKWEHDGILLTILKMWSLRLFYFLGINPNKLAKLY